MSALIAYDPYTAMFGSSGPTRDAKRSFTGSQKAAIWDNQKGRCARCKERLMRAAVHYDHKKPWELGGRTTVSNGQALCPNCHAVKTNEDRLKRTDKTATSSKRRKATMKKRSRRSNDPFGLGNDPLGLRRGSGRF